jgi:hypothetical protein
MNDAVDMSFTDLVAKLNEIETRETAERRAKHKVQVENANRNKSKKVRSIKEGLDQALLMQENVLGVTNEEPLGFISPDLFNNKEAKAEVAETDQYSASNSRALMVQLDNMHTQMQKKVEEIYATDNGDLQDQITTMLKVLDNLNAVIARSMKVIPAAEYDPTESVQEGDDYRDGHDINLLKAVAKQFAEDLGNSDYTAIDELLKNVPESDMRAYLPLGRSEMESVQEDMDPKGPEVTIGDYTTKNFYMCGGAIDTAEKFPDNEGMEKLIRLQDLMFGLEADVMNGMEATDEVIEFGTELTDAIMDQAKVAGIEKEVEEYQPMHLAAIKTGDPEPGYGRVDTEEED